MSKQKGFVQILVLVLLLGGLFAGLYLIKNPVKFFPKAKEGPIGNYIVVLTDGIDNPAKNVLDLADEHSLAANQIFSTVFRGFSAQIPLEKVEKLKLDPRVAFVSEDREVHTDVPPNRTPKPATTNQQLPTGIDRIDAENKVNRGSGIGVAVVDTGVDLNHQDLRDNILAGKSCIPGGKSANDDNGHGTHISGIITALNNSQGVIGVAPESKIIAVKVLNSSGVGNWSQVICGIDWVLANASKYNIRVVNLSLSGGGSSDENCGLTNSDALHQAICKARDSGLTLVVSAGNSGSDATNNVPAAYDDAVITVSALNDTDGKSGGIGTANSAEVDDSFPNFSNYGSMVDLAAPGVDINSTWFGGEYKILSGTSQGAAHVSGASALYLKAHPGSSWIQVKEDLKSLGEQLNNGHTDPSGRHPEPLVKANTL